MYRDIFVVTAAHESTGAESAHAQAVAREQAVATGDVDFVKTPTDIDRLPEGVTAESRRVYGAVDRLDADDLPESKTTIWQLSAHVKPGDDLFPVDSQSGSEAQA